MILEFHINQRKPFLVCRETRQYQESTRLLGGSPGYKTLGYRRTLLYVIPRVLDWGSDR